MKHWLCLSIDCFDTSCAKANIGCLSTGCVSSTIVLMQKLALVASTLVVLVKQ